MPVLESQAHHHTVTCPAEADLHPAVRTLVGIRHGYSIEPSVKKLRSGTFNLHRNAPLGMVAMAGEILLEEGIIPPTATYIPDLKSFAGKFLDVGGGLYSTMRTTEEVASAVALMDAILNDVHPGHETFSNHFRFIEKTHDTLTRAPWMV